MRFVCIHKGQLDWVLICFHWVALLWPQVLSLVLFSPEFSSTAKPFHILISEFIKWEFSSLDFAIKSWEVCLHGVKGGSSIFGAGNMAVMQTAKVPFLRDHRGWMRKPLKLLDGSPFNATCDVNSIHCALNMYCFYSSRRKFPEEETRSHVLYSPWHWAYWPVLLMKYNLKAQRHYLSRGRDQETLVN